MVAQRAVIPSPKKQEVRAVWITTVNGLDWPKSTDSVEQKKSLREIVERLHSAHFNTIFFQVRGRGDAMYRSAYEPWSQLLTGIFGKDPGWDPLQYILEEAHVYGMEVHAWFNTFLIKSSKQPTPETSPRHIVLQHPGWLANVDGEFWLDPGLPAVREYLVNVALDIVRHYDIDGLHFDFVRYPQKTFPDEATFRRYGGKKTKEDWRRENITKFVRSCYESALRIKPMLKIGSAPIGIYTNFGAIKGLQSYYDLFQDSRGWLEEKIQDYLVPQVYWSLGDQKADPDFAAVAKEWSANSFGRQISIGIGAYKPEVHKELPELIDVTRAFGLSGNSFFRYDNVADVLTLGGRYQSLANIPPMPWKDAIPPNAPADLFVENVYDGVVKLHWNAPSVAPDGDKAKQYNVYRSIQKRVDVNDPNNLIAITHSTVTQYQDTIRHPSALRYYYTVSALDKGNNESAPALEKSIVIPELASLAEQFDLKFRLGDNYPNPASSVMYIPYEIEHASPVFLKILDGSNREIVSVVDALQEPGRYIASANISGLKQGAYSYLLIAGNFREKKMFRVVN